MVEDGRGEQITKELVPVAEQVLRPSQPRPSGASRKKTSR
jgi:hypothetical protein